MPINAPINSLGLSFLNVTKVASDYFLNASLFGWRMLLINVANWSSSLMLKFIIYK